jgi:hypothetical protein
MRTGLLALAMFIPIMGGELASREDPKISSAPSFKNRSSVNGRDFDLSGDAGNFCKCPAFSA